MGNSTRSVSTRARLLDAAAAEFAERGFRDATIQRICKRASANIAAVHYHFGDKERLYQAVFEFAERRAREDAGPPVAPTGPPAEQLRVHVGAFLRRLLDPQRPAWFARLLAHELIDPTPALDRVVRRRMRANHAQFASIIRALAPRATDDAVRLATLSIVAQCVFYRNSHAVVTRLYPEIDPAHEVEHLADHVTRFSLAAIERLGEARKGARP
jgi:AcrR family transcriptional regulator